MCLGMYLPALGALGAELGPQASLYEVQQQVVRPQVEKKRCRFAELGPRTVRTCSGPFSATLSHSKGSYSVFLRWAEFSTRPNLGRK